MMASPSAAMPGELPWCPKLQRRAASRSAFATVAHQGSKGGSLNSPDYDGGRGSPHSPIGAIPSCCIYCFPSNFYQVPAEDSVLQTFIKRSPGTRRSSECARRRLLMKIRCSLLFKASLKITQLPRPMKVSVVNPRRRHARSNPHRPVSAVNPRLKY